MDQLSVTNPKVKEGKAWTTKKAFSRETAIRIEILADPGIVWALLTNAADYPRWKSTVTALKGEIKEGETIQLKSILDDKRTFKLKVKEMQPNARMVWGDSMGNRVYTHEKAGGRTRFKKAENLGGPLFPLFARYIPLFDETLERFAADLKKEAETIQ